MTKQSGNKSALKELFIYIGQLALAAILVLLLNKFVIVNANIPTGSMNDTVDTESLVLVNRLYTINMEVKRGDILMFIPPDDSSDYYLKRVIGLPGDTVEGIDGYVYINGEKLVEDYVKDTLKDDFGPYNVPDNSYFMLGDNRLNSNDSRYWNNKFVSRESIIGKAVVQYYPKFKKLK